MRSTVGVIACMWGAAIGSGCTKRQVLYTFEPPPVGAAYTRRDPELHHELSETLIACQRELDRRHERDRADAWKRRLLQLLAGAVAAFGQGLSGFEPSLESDRPCDRSRVGEARCGLQGTAQVAIGPTLTPNGELEDSPRSGLALRADIDATIRQLDDLLERPELEGDRTRTMEAIRALAAECTPSPSPLSADPAPATLAP